MNFSQISDGSRIGSSQSSRDSELVKNTSSTLQVLSDTLLHVKARRLRTTHAYLLLQTTPFRVRGCILTVVERMCEEYIKMLQSCDAHSTEYVER